MSEISHPHIQVIEDDDGFYVFDEVGSKILTEALSFAEALEQQRKIVEALRLGNFPT